MTTPLDPIPDFGRHNTVLHLMLGIEALATHVEALAEPITAGSAASTPQHAGDDFVHALMGLVALGTSIRALADVGGVHR